MQTLHTGSSLFDRRNWTLYNSVNFRPSSGRDVLLEFLVRLPAQIPAVNEEEDSPRLGEFHETINRTDRRVGLSAPGRHLDQRAGTVHAEGFFQVLDGRDLCRPQSLLD